MITLFIKCEMLKNLIKQLNLSVTALEDFQGFISDLYFSEDENERNEIIQIWVHHFLFEYENYSSGNYKKIKKSVKDLAYDYNFENNYLHKHLEEIFNGFKNIVI